MTRSKEPRQFDIVPLLVAGLVICASLHAQSTGLFVNSSNNVGIGTTNPAKPLQVSAVGSYPTASEQVRVTDPTNGMTVSLLADGANGFGAIYATIPGTGYKPLYIQPYGQNTIMNSAGGNVGIGTTTPVQKLHLLGPAGAPATSGTTQGGLLRFGQTTDNGILDMGVQALGAGAWLQSADKTTLAVSYPLLLNPNGGNVGIGTVSPGYKLDVNGQVHASAFVAPSQTYADFVFKPGYKLPPLSDVEASIQKDGHLPGIPSEAEAKAHGIDLAAMQIKLLQKIEELTLHVISQEKRLDEQNGRIEQLEKENAELREKVTK